LALKEHHDMENRAAAVQNAMAAAMQGSEDSAKIAQDYLKWKQSKEAYEQVAYRDIAAQEENKTETSPEGDALFDVLGKKAEALDGTPGYQALLDYAVAKEENRSHAFAEGIKAAKSVSSFFPSTDMTKSAEWYEAANAGGPSYVPHANQMQTKQTSGTAALTAQAPIKAGEEVEAKHAFLFNAGGVLPMEAGEHAVVVALGAKGSGVAVVQDTKGDSGDFPTSDLAPAPAPAPAQGAAKDAAPAAKGAPGAAEEMAPEAAPAPAAAGAAGPEARGMTTEQARAAWENREPTPAAVAHVTAEKARRVEEAALVHAKAMIADAIMQGNRRREEAQQAEERASAAHRAARGEPAARAASQSAQTPAETVADGIVAFQRNFEAARNLELQRSAQHAGKVASRVAAAVTQAQVHAASRVAQEQLAKAADAARHALVEDQERREGDAIATSLGEAERRFEEAHRKEAARVAEKRATKVNLVHQAETAVKAQSVLGLKALAKAARGQEGAGALAVLQDAESKLRERAILEQQAKADAAAVKAAAVIARAHDSTLAGFSGQESRYERRLENQERRLDAAGLRA
jgi:hypothetical protein